MLSQRSPGCVAARSETLCGVSRNPVSKRESTKRSHTARTNAPVVVGAEMVKPGDAGRAGRLIGYARVSTDEQTTALQLDALRAAGCVMIVEESASGALGSRPGLNQALAELKPGDTLVVWKLDRLGRSLRHLLQVADEIRARGVALRSLTDHIDTGTAAGRMLYAVLGSVAEFERDVLRERTLAGLAAARRRGEQLGRRRALTPAQVAEAKVMLDRGEGGAYVARVFEVGRSTLYRAIARSGGRRSVEPS